MQNHINKSLHIPAKPFIKWVGGKRQLLPELCKRLPSTLDVYFEPFVGGGALFFQISHRINEAYLSDLNQDLIYAYKTIQTNVNTLIQELLNHKNNQEYFLSIRNADRDKDYDLNWSPTQKAARLIYLNKTCFNGLYRVNSKGNFNVPYGKYENPKIVDCENLHACNSTLNNSRVFIDCISYKETLSKIEFLTSLGRKVFVYIDPPYIPISSTSSFTQYSKNSFGIDEQHELKLYCDKLTKLGVCWMQSNSSAKEVFELYKNYNIELVGVNRTISANTNSRKRINECIIRNYE